MHSHRYLVKVTLESDNKDLVEKVCRNVTKKDIVILLEAMKQSQQCLVKLVYNDILETC